MQTTIPTDPADLAAIPPITSHNVRSVITYGSGGLPVDIECHLANSLPTMVIVGFAHKTVDESRERIRGAFSNAGLTMSRKRICINLAPADVPKDSSSLDVPIALAILCASNLLNSYPQTHEAFIGELSLDGTIRPVRGIIGKLVSGRSHGIRRFYIPADNFMQASVVPHIELVPVGHLRQLAGHFAGESQLRTIETGNGRLHLTNTTLTPAGLDDHVRLTDVIGQERAKRALQVAAAGGHNLLFDGPPGVGKSMLAKALAGILPPLSHEEMLETSHLHSLAGRDFEQLVINRPFRSPHHTASHTAIVGGGPTIRPGEISLAHRGVLLLDEAPEFARATIEALRQPLEDRQITIARARESISFPADFIFVATANPCPCGYAGVSTRYCQCSAAAVRLYQRKLSGPLLDRIDICVTVESVAHEKLLDNTTHSDDDDYNNGIKELVLLARERQHIRFGDSGRLNSAMTNQEVRDYCQLTASARAILDLAGRQHNLSARAYMRCLKVARTIADLDGSGIIKKIHITEALRYRRQTVTS